MTESNDRTGDPDAGIFEAMFDDAPCGYVALAIDGAIVRVNHRFARFVGADRDGLVGRRFVELLSIPARIYYETHVAPLLRMQGAVDEVALELAGADGRNVPVFVNGVDRRGQCDRSAPVWLTVFRATDRRRYESELLASREEQRALMGKTTADKLALEAVLRQSQKMEVVGQLTAGLAHDFNNILVSVSGAFEMMQRRFAQGRGDEVQKYIAVGQEAAQRAIALIARLLAFSRKQESAPAQIDVNAVVAGMQDLVCRTVGSRIRVDVALVDGTASATIDANQLESALLNLCVNARDAMPDGGALTIATGNVAVADAEPREVKLTPGDYVLLRVRDTGTGMSADVADRILEPFYTTKPVGKGTGLGLAMVYELTRQAQGGLSIDSAVGRGTTVTLFFPRADGRAGSSVALPAAP